MNGPAAAVFWIAIIAGSFLGLSLVAAYAVVADLLRRRRRERMLRQRAALRYMPRA